MIKLMISSKISAPLRLPVSAFTCFRVFLGVIMTPAGIAGDHAYPVKFYCFSAT